MKMKQYLTMTTSAFTVFLLALNNLSSANIGCLDFNAQELMTEIGTNGEMFTITKSSTHGIYTLNWVGRSYFPSPAGTHLLSVEPRDHSISLMKCTYGLKAETGTSGIQIPFTAALMSIRPAIGPAVLDPAIVTQLIEDYHPPHELPTHKIGNITWKLTSVEILSPAKVKSAILSHSVTKKNSRNGIMNTYVVTFENDSTTTLTLESDDITSSNLEELMQ